MIRYAALPVLCLAIAACGDEPAPAEPPQQENLDARAEVLGGTISDDMLPLDTLTSQAPSRAAPQQETESEAAPEAEEAVEAEVEPEAPAPAEASAEEVAPDSGEAED